MTNDSLGDWRIELATTLVQSFGSAPIGSPVRLMSTAKHKKHNYLGFVTPSPAALCLNIALSASALSEAIRPRLLLTPMVTHDGKRGSNVKDESIGDLFYFFEQSIISVTMSFQAIEIFTNAVIGRRSSETIVVKRKGGVQKSLSSTAAERELSTEEKLGQVLPRILNVTSPRGNRVWQHFKALKDARDGTVHLKSRDIYTRNNIDRESLFFSFLSTDICKFPGAAIKVISHFFPKDPPRWLRHAKEIAARDSRLGNAMTAL